MLSIPGIKTALNELFSFCFPLSIACLILKRTGKPMVRCWAVELPHWNCGEPGNSGRGQTRALIPQRREHRRILHLRWLLPNLTQLLILIKCIREQWISVCHTVLVLVMLTGVTGSEIVQKTVKNHADSEVLFNSSGSAQHPCQNFWSKIKLPSGSFWIFKGMSVNIYAL